LFLDSLNTERIINQYKKNLKVKNILFKDKDRFIEMAKSTQYSLGDIKNEFGLTCDERYISKIVSELGLKLVWKKKTEHKINGKYVYYKKRNLPREAKNPAQYIDLYFNKTQFKKVCSELKIDYTAYKYFKKRQIIQEHLELFINYMEARDMNGIYKKSNSLHG
jgi:hypothetical protein